MMSMLFWWRYGIMTATFDAHVDREALSGKLLAASPPRSEGRRQPQAPWRLLWPPRLRI